MDADTMVRVKTLKMLCQMNPQYGKVLRAECVSLCKLAGLAIELTIAGDKEGKKILFFCYCFFPDDFLSTCSDKLSKLKW